MDEPITQWKVDWNDERKVLNHAYVDTVYWWVNLENKYHTLFSGGNTSFKKDEKKFVDTFYEFTNKYSVRRTVSGSGKKPVNELLNKLMAVIDGFITGTEEVENWKATRSLVSKFATLINPLKYAMYDGNAAKALSMIKYGRKTSAYNNYNSYFKDFVKFKSAFLEDLKPEDIDFWLKSCLYGKFNIDPEVCTEDIFKGRLTDKFLWCYYNMKMRKIRIKSVIHEQTII